MKYFKPLTLVFLLIFTVQYNLFGQNPNWTMPPYKFTPENNGYNPLPQPSSGSYMYTGAPATHMHAAYSDAADNMVLFTVDDQAYDKNGNFIGDMFIDNHSKRGFAERLILPMGKDCSRYAIIYAASSEDDEHYGYTLFQRRLYMAEYDMNSSLLPGSIGSLKLYDNAASSLIDISKRDADLYGYPAGGPALYHFGPNGQEYGKTIQLAATELINNCFYYVYVSDGRYLMRYKLSENGFNFDNYVYEMKPNHETYSRLRSEMELIKLKNGNYRVAVPMLNPPNAHNGILTMDLSGQTGEVLTNTVHTIPLAFGAHDSNPYGIEFDPTGRYVYITHEAVPGFSDALDVYDMNASGYLNLPALSGINKFRRSFIERSGNKLYLATDDYIGELSNISSNVSSQLSFNQNFISITSGYGSGLGAGTSSAYFRYLLPDQVDMPYTRLEELSCECCKSWHGDVDKYTASGTETWTPGNNPFGGSNGTVYVTNEIRIPAGADITISDMDFYFAPSARVVVEKANGSTPPGFLKLTDGTVFTADDYCSANPIVSCGIPEPCNREFWQGVRVEGAATDPTQSTHVQGNFKMERGSMIEYAVAGIRVGHETLADYGGGIISIRDSYLKDNLTGIKFDPYARLGGGIEFYNKSGIYRNAFTTTDDWFSNQIPKAFVDVTGSSGLYIKGNSFENSNTAADFNDAYRGTGIQLSDSRVEASWGCANTPGPCQAPVQNPIRNVFKDLTYGIHGINSAGNVRTLTCNYGLFENTYIGIYLAGFIQPKVLDNTFEVQSADHFSVGLFLNSSTGYAVQNNQFSTWQDATFGNRYGIYVAYSGETANEIYRNHFDNLTLGGYVFGVNTEDGGDNGYANGLRWKCNVFDQPIVTADILLNGTMSDEQGSCTSGPAGNLFSHSSNNSSYPSHKGLSSTPGSTIDIDYKHHKNTTAYPRLTPLQYSGQTGTPAYYVLASCVNYADFSPETSCPEILSGAPITDVIGPGMAAQGSGEPMSYATLSEEVADLSAEITTLENQLSGTGFETESTDETEAELAQLKAQYRKLWHRAISQYQADTTGTLSTENLQSLLAEYRPQSAERFASILLPEASLGWIANDNLSAVEAFSGDVGLPAPVDGSLPYEIPEWFEGDFFGTASNTSALNALYIDNNEIYMPYIPPVAVDEADWNGYIPGNPGAGDNASSDLTVQPNPFNESVHFNLSNYEIKGKNNRLEFYDITGRKIFVKTIGEDQSQIELSGDHFPQGIVLYTLFVNNVARENGKIIRTE